MKEVGDSENSPWHIKLGERGFDIRAQCPRSIMAAVEKAYEKQQLTLWVAADEERITLAFCRG